MYLISEHKIVSLSWMGGDTQDEGVLAVSSDGGFVGINCTSTKPAGDVARKTCNLYSHQHAPHVLKVLWNAVVEELASCDEAGGVYLWVYQRDRCAVRDKYRCQLPGVDVVVVDMAWSHDFRTLAVCQNNAKVTAIAVDEPQRTCFTLMHPRSERTFLCVTFSPDDRSLYFGTSDGYLAVFDMHGNGELTYEKICSRKQCAVTSVQWNVPREYTDWNIERFTLAAGLADGAVCFMRDYDDVDRHIVHTGLYGMKLHWSISGQMLAAVGYSMDVTCEDRRAVDLDLRSYSNALVILSNQGQRLMQVAITPPCPSLTFTAASAVAWGHEDTRVFVSVGCEVHSVQVLLRGEVASLQQLCCTALCSRLRLKLDIKAIALPPTVRARVLPLLHYTVAMPVPLADHRELREYLRRPPPSQERHYCTLTVTGASRYSLFLERLGGLYPLLEAKRLGGAHPEFALFQPSAPHENRAAMFNSCSPDTRSILACITCNVSKTKFTIYDTASEHTAVTGKVSYKPSLLRMSPRELAITLIHVAPATEQASREDRGVHQGLEDSSKQQEFGRLRPTTLHERVIYIDLSTEPPFVNYQQSLPLFELCCEYKELYWRKLFHTLPTTRSSCWSSQIIQTRVFRSILWIENMLRVNRSIYNVNISNKELLQTSSQTVPVMYVYHPAHLTIYGDVQHFIDSITDIGTKRIVKVNTFKPLWSPLRFLRNGKHDMKPFGLSDSNTEEDCSTCQGKCCERVIVLRNKSPTWNKCRALYELMFNGRASLQSEKNCQFEYGGEIVMQIGKLSNYAFSLDFAYPFSAVQAFAVALSSITHGLK